MNYISDRRALITSPEFLAAGRDIGSGPTVERSERASDARQPSASAKPCDSKTTAAAGTKTTPSPSAPSKPPAKAASPKPSGTSNTPHTDPELAHQNLDAHEAG